MDDLRMQVKSQSGVSAGLKYQTAADRTKDGRRKSSLLPFGES